MHLYLVRHAQSQNNALPESQRVEDPGITDLGMEQATALAEHLRLLHFDVLLTSAFLRAMETMRPLAEGREVKPIIWTDLHEQGGCYRGHVNPLGAPGRNRNQILTEFPTFEVPDDIDEQGWWKNKPYETYELTVDRAKRIIQRLRSEFANSGKTVACVIHADFKAILLNEMLGKPEEVWAGDLRNTGVTQLKFNDDLFQMTSFNDTSHLTNAKQS